MKNAKKLLILALTLVMLIAACAIVVSAEGAEGNDVLTIKYQDGTVQTYAEGETITPPAVPTDFVVVDADGKAYKYTVTGSAWEGVPAEVTADLLGTTVNATVAGTKGTEQVYYVSIETVRGVTKTVYHLSNDVHTYFSSSNTGDKGDGTNTGAFAAKDLYVKTDKEDNTYSYERMAAETKASVVKVILYADVDVSSFTTSWYKLTGSRIANSLIPAYLDLNGHTVTTSQTGYLHGYGIYLRIYSSVPGAHWYQTQSSCLARMNDDAVFLLGNEYLGGPYASNISFHCKGISGDQYGGGIGIAGGKFYQTASNGQTGFLDVYRRVSALQDAELYTVAGVSPLVHSSAGEPYAIGNGKGTIKNCKFYSPSPVNFITGAGASKFGVENCTFVNVVPTGAALPAGSAIVFKTGNVSNIFVDGNLGTDAAPIVCANTDPFAIEGLVAADGSAIAATAIYRLVNPADALKVNTPVGTSYWTIGATFPVSAGSLVQIDEDGIVHSDGVYNVEGVAEIVDGKVAAAGEVTVLIVFNKHEGVAFSYKNLATGDLGYVTYEECGSTAAGVFEKFYEIFNAPDAGYLITMYQDMIVNKAMGFGKYVESADKYNPEKPNNTLYNRDYYDTLAKGSIVWDLNGTTVTISADTTGFINPAAANHVLNSSGWNSSNPATVFGFEGYNATNTFTVKSSKAGGKIVNAGATHSKNVAIFGAGEGKSTRVVFEGENLTIDAKNAFLFYGIEMGSTTATDPRLTVNGGTYIGAYAQGVMYFCGNTVVSDATFISTNASVAQLTVLDSYRDGSITFNNVTFIAQNPTAPAFYSSSSKTHNATFTDCIYIGCEPTSTTRFPKIKSLEYKGITKADTENALLVAFGAKPADKALAKFITEINGETVILLGYGASNEIFTVTYNGVADTEYYLVGSVLVIPEATELADPYYKDGIYVDIEGYKGYFVNETVTAEMAGKTADIFAYINYVEKPLAFVVVHQGEIVSHVLLDAEDLGAELAATLAAQTEYFDLLAYTDLDATETLVISAEGYINLNGNTLILRNTIENTVAFEINNGKVIILDDIDAIFADDAILSYVFLYKFAAETVLTDASATVIASKVYNVLFPEETKFVGTVYHTDENAGGVIYNNNETDVLVGDDVHTVSYTRVVTDNENLIATATFMYKGEVKGSVDYFVGSIPGFYHEAISGYYYSYKTNAPIYEDAEFVCLFVTEESKLKGQIVVTEALNFIFYLQKQEGIDSIVFNGMLLNFEDIAVEMIGDLEYYMIPVVFESFADCLLPATLEVGLAFGDSVETVTAKVSLLDYAQELFANGEATAEEKALVYALLDYVNAIISYFKYDVENGVPALLAANAKYATAYAPAAVEKITSDYIRGALYIVDEQISLALRVDADFAGEIIVSLAGAEDAKATFTAEDLKEIDGKSYAVLEDLPFSEIAAGYDISVVVDGEVVDAFTYTVADYTDAMTAQNMGYVPAYARALYIFATLAAAYVA